MIETLTRLLGPIPERTIPATGEPFARPGVGRLRPDPHRCLGGAVAAIDAAEDDREIVRRVTP